MSEYFCPTCGYIGIHPNCERCGCAAYKTQGD